ncbi:hypothetical protein cyc_07479 [Cyclospora cayetanensis]|uniref:Uncharacterized protein n=1 Tax=Cyclospora cayetanensis TaxID=88456 RepID=A0A1D3DAU2_9EIME|nr:hypothetical protein cyc_07479 [Cyclospora cayetanensis]
MSCVDEPFISQVPAGKSQLPLNAFIDIHDVVPRMRAHDGRGATAAVYYAGRSKARYGLLSPSSASPEIRATIQLFLHTPPMRMGVSSTAIRRFCMHYLPRIPAEAPMRIAAGNERTDSLDATTGEAGGGRIGRARSFPQAAVCRTRIAACAPLLPEKRQPAGKSSAIRRAARQALPSLHKNETPPARLYTAASRAQQTADRTLTATHEATSSLAVWRALPKFDAATALEHTQWQQQSPHANACPKARALDRHLPSAEGDGLPGLFNIACNGKISIHHSVPTVFLQRCQQGRILGLTLRVSPSPFAPEVGHLHASGEHPCTKKRCLLPRSPTQEGVVSFFHAA